MANIADSTLEKETEKEEEEADEVGAEEEWMEEKEKLDEDQKAFLSRMEELDRLSAPPTALHLNQSRLNFGMQAVTSPKLVRQRAAAASGLRQQSGKPPDKGYAGLQQLRHQQQHRMRQQQHQRRIPTAIRGHQSASSDSFQRPTVQSLKLDELRIEGSSRARGVMDSSSDVDYEHLKENKPVGLGSVNMDVAIFRSVSKLCRPPGFSNIGPVEAKTGAASLGLLARGGEPITSESQSTETTTGSVDLGRGVVVADQGKSTTTPRLSLGSLATEHLKIIQAGIGSLASGQTISTGTTGPSLGSSVREHPTTTPVPGLGSLASEHCKSTTPNLSLESLASEHLKIASEGLSLDAVAGEHDKSATGTTGLSLGSLAKEHLATTASTSLNLRPLAREISLNSPVPPPGLSSLAEEHLKSTTSVLNLGSLAREHQKITSVAFNYSCDGQAPALSLGSLASEHQKALDGPQVGLGALARQHLADSTQQQGLQRPAQFTIPALFGSSCNRLVQSPSMSPPSLLTSIPTLPAPTLLRETSPDIDIDLTAALKLEVTQPEQLAPAAVDDSLAAVVKGAATMLYADMAEIRSKLRTRNCSTLGKVVVRRWRRIQPHTKLVILLHPDDVDRFRFDVPSPDDIVRKAQSQSRTFSARSSSSPVRQGSPMRS